METSSQSFINKYSPSYYKSTIKRLERLYYKNYPTKLTPSKKERIPKIIHQIWVGPKPIPAYLYKSQESWKKLHPGWDYILWTNATAEPLVKLFAPYHQKLYYNATDIREQANILRYYLILWFGGVYADADMECLKSFEKLHYLYDFYVGISCNTSKTIVNNALIGAKPNHPILKKVINLIGKSTDEIESTSSLPSPLNRSGVWHFSRVCTRYIDSAEGINIALPKSFIYTVPLYNPKEIPAEKFEKPESMALHYWAYTNLCPKQKLKVKIPKPVSFAKPSASRSEGVRPNIYGRYE